MQQGEELWHRIQQALQATLSKPSFETWIRPARCGGYADGRLRVVTPNSFARGWLRRKIGGPWRCRFDVLGAPSQGTPKLWSAKTSAISLRTRTP